MDFEPHVDALEEDEKFMLLQDFFDRVRKTTNFTKEGIFEIENKVGSLLKRKLDREALGQDYDDQMAIMNRKQHERYKK